LRNFFFLAADTKVEAGQLNEYAAWWMTEKKNWVQFPAETSVFSLFSSTDTGCEPRLGFYSWHVLGPPSLEMMQQEGTAKTLSQV